MALIEGGVSRSTLGIENKENVQQKVAKSYSEMKTIPQAMNKVCATLVSNQQKVVVSSETSKSSMSRPLSTKSPIGGRTLKPAKRRGLATLQPSATSRNSVVGGLRKIEAPRGDLKQTKFEIFTEESRKADRRASRPNSKNEGQPPCKVATTNISTQTDFEEWLSLEETKEKDTLAEEALALMRSEPSELQYLKEIAEERRSALEETLRENEDLFDELDSLKGKCESLEKALSEAENFKLLYMAMVEKNEEKEGS